MLGGLSVVGAWKPILLGEFGFDAACTWRLRLFLNCCRSSRVLRCWLSDCRRGAGVTLSGGAERCPMSPEELAAGREELTDSAVDRSARLADLELPWLDDLRWLRAPLLAASIRDGRDTGGREPGPTGVEVPLSERPCGLLRGRSSPRTGCGVPTSCGVTAPSADAVRSRRPSLAIRSLLSRRCCRLCSCLAR